MENNRVLLGMSGGVDSSVSAIILKNKGYEVIGVTMRLFEDKDFDYNENGCCNLTTINDAKRVCDKLGINHYVYDFRKEFKEYVIDNFVNEYKIGRTPNPCIECNKYLKFGQMFKLAKKLNCKYIATGHYARVCYDEEYNSYVLRKSSNLIKDQSYVLYGISKDILPFVLFPLEDFQSKDEVRKIARDNGLLIANKPDSEDICFIPDNNHVRFLDEKIKVNQGNIIDLSGEVKGKHSGFTHYTIGQRKGLGIQNKNPLYVLNIDSNRNLITVGEKYSALSYELIIENINILMPNVLNKNGIKVTAKIRYKSKDAKAIAYLEDDNIRLVFDTPQFAITPGQSAVIYIDDIVVAGGIIK